ncbi:MAG: hypothetical protein K9G62_05370 [Alphaproteobacteria bacterium]|nr:hypothetical protein [Alphaproteobacteria bacterium]
MKNVFLFRLLVIIALVGAAPSPAFAQWVQKKSAVSGHPLQANGLLKDNERLSLDDAEDYIVDKILENQQIEAQVSRHMEGRCSPKEKQAYEKLRSRVTAVSLSGASASRKEDELTAMLADPTKSQIIIKLFAECGTPAETNEISRYGASR